MWILEEAPASATIRNADECAALHLLVLALAKTCGVLCATLYMSAWHSERRRSACRMCRKQTEVRPLSYLLQLLQFGSPRVSLRLAWPNEAASGG